MEIINLILAAAFGAVATYLVSLQLHHEQRPSRRLRCRPTYCSDLLADSTGPLGEGLELRLGGDLLENPIVAYFTIDHVGNDVAHDLTILIRATQDDRIAKAQVLLQNELHCERIKSQEQSQSLLRYKISFMNPGDVIVIAVLLSPCESAECMSIQIEGEGVEVKHAEMAMDCQSHLPGPLIAVPISPSDVARSRAT